MNDSKGFSEVTSVILVIFLVLALALVTYGMLSGSIDPKYLQKSVYVAGTAKEATVTQGAVPYNLLTFQADAGDPFYINGQSSPSGTKTTLRVISPDGRNLTPDASALSGSLYGKTLYLFQKSGANACDFGITDKVPNVNTLPSMLIGKYNIQLIDEKVHVLAATYPTNITKGTSSLPANTLMGTGTGTGYKSDCSVLTGTCSPTTTGGCPTVYNTSPCNKTYEKFDSSKSQYLSFPDDPTFKYNSTMSMSLEIRPITTGAYSNSDTTNWHNIIGKGVTNGVNDENDNYQLAQMGDRLYFEWNDAITGIHYHAMTPEHILTAGSWDQIDVVVTGGQLAIYNNGVSQPLSYYQSNVPGTNPISAPTVNLQNNGNSVIIAKQNGDPVIYFNGDIGAISLYNRALTPTEIANDVCIA